MTFDNTEIVSAITLSGVIFSAILSSVIAYASSRKNIFINAVTTERMKWIKELGDIIVDFQDSVLSLVVGMRTDATYRTSSQRFTDLKRIQSLEAKIVIHLQGRGIIENNVAKLTRSFSSSALDYTKDVNSDKKGVLFSTYGDLLPLHSNFLFKQEWEKVKIEASGPLYAYWLRFKLRKRIAIYRYFADGEGYFTEIDQSPRHQFERPPKKGYVFPAVTHPSSKPQ